MLSSPPRRSDAALKALEYVFVAVGVLLALGLTIVVLWAIFEKPHMDRECAREEERTGTTCDYWMK